MLHNKMMLRIRYCVYSTQIMHLAIAVATVAAAMVAVTTATVAHHHQNTSDHIQTQNRRTSNSNVDQ